MEMLAEYLQLSEQLKQIKVQQKHVKENIGYCIDSIKEDLKSKLTPYINEAFSIDNSYWDSNLIFYDYGSVSFEYEISIVLNISKLIIEDLRKEFPFIKTNLRKRHDFQLIFSYNILTSKINTRTNNVNLIKDIVENDDNMKLALYHWLQKINENFSGNDLSFQQMIERLLSIKREIHNLHSFYTLNKLVEEK